MIDIPYEVKNILGVLKSNGRKAYIVGGCVRDSLINKTPKDWDVTTDAPPDEIKKYFRGYNVIDTGVKHGTVSVCAGGSVYEITAFRKDGAYTDNRRPDAVTFISDLYTDLSRRDFTINALAYNEDEGLIDYFGGVSDLNDKIIKTAGDPRKRFEEDALRIIRALRFSSVLNFSIESGTDAAIFNCKHLLKNIAIERITAEFNKILHTDNYAAVIKKYKEVFLEVIPKINDVNNSAGNYLVRLALLLDHTALKELRYDNKTIKTVKAIQTFPGCGGDGYSLAKAMRELGKDGFKLWCEYKHALTNDDKYISMRSACGGIAFYSLAHLNINGFDLKNAGFKNGANIGAALEKLYGCVLSGAVSNDLNALTERSKIYMKTLYISDLDGTLLNSNAELSAYTIESLNGLIKRGADFTIATARSVTSAAEILKDVNIRIPAILMNGVCIYDLQAKKYLKICPMNKNSCLNLFKTLEKHNLYGFLYTIEDGVRNTYYICADTPHAEKFIEERLAKYKKVFTKVDSLYSCIDKNIVHYSVSDTYERLLECYTELKNDAGINAEFYKDTYHSVNWYLEISDKSASKYNAVKYLINEYHYDKVVSFGDNLNDIPMFRASDYSCAVENAKQETKDAANEIIGGSNDDGVVKWLNANAGGAMDLIENQ